MIWLNDLNLKYYMQLTWITSNQHNYLQLLYTDFLKLTLLKLSQHGVALYAWKGYYASNNSLILPVPRRILILTGFLLSYSGYHTIGIVGWGWGNRGSRSLKIRILNTWRRWKISLNSVCKIYGFHYVC